MSDRGYENYNVIENIKQNGMDFLIRIKDIKSNGIKANLDKYKFMPKNQNFDFLLSEDKEVYSLNFGIVRFSIGENSYEVLVTSLSRDEFTIEKLKL